MLSLAANCFAEFFDAKALRPGMKATGYTVFSSAQGLEPFELEIVGQMTNFVGPGQDLLIARVLGERFQKSSVVAGMSGSPVYIDGKLVGALSYAFGRFTANAVAGITPIQSMLAHRKASPQLAALPSGSLRPIALSLVAQGLSPSVAKHFDAELHRRGLASPVLAAGSVGTSLPKTTPLYPGAPFSALLISGDMTLACIGTVTWMEGSEFVGLGHPFLQNGVSELPVAGAEIVTTIFGQDEPYKMGQPTEIIGVLTSDRSSGVTGIVGKKPRTMPLEVQFGGKTWHYNISRMGKDTAFLTSMAFSNSLAMTPEHELGGTYKINVELQISGGEKLSYERMLSAQNQPLEPGAIALFLEPIVMLQNQDFKKVEFESMKVQVTHTAEIRTTRLLGFTVFSEPKPDEPLEMLIYSQPWQKPLQKQRLVLNMPRWNSSGAYQIIGLDRMSSFNLEKESGFWAEVPSYAVLINKIRSLPKDTELCFYLKETGQASNFLGYNLTDLPISLKETLTDVRAGSEISFNTKATRLGCADLGEVVTGKVLKEYKENGEKR